MTLGEPDYVRIPVAKLILDKALGSLLLLLTSPISIAIVIAIKAGGLLNREDRGPVFYREVRVSQGRPFNLTKFRIFRLPAIERIRAGAVTKEIENQPGSLTAAGHFLKKFGLDEIPQFYTILKGDMSFVGPRPKPVAEYEAEVARGIFRGRVIRAGLSGAAQVMKGTVRTLDDEIARDYDYIEQCRELSGWRVALMDLSILLQTVRVVLKGTGE